MHHTLSKCQFTFYDDVGNWPNFYGFIVIANGELDMFYITEKNCSVVTGMLRYKKNQLRAKSQ